MRKLECFYDVVSPYSYLAFEVLLRYRQRWDLDVVWRPAFLGGVMKAVGNVPPASLPQRAPYLLRDLARKSRFYDLALMVPEDFPSNTLTPMRLTTLVQLEQPQKLEAFSRALFRRHWGEGKEVQSEEALRAVLSSVELDPALATRLAEPQVKEQLKKDTDEVIARGAFGFPAMFIDVDGDNEMFFGSDRFDVLANELKLEWHGPRGPQT